MKRRNRVGYSSLLALALLTTACGDDDDTATEDTAAEDTTVEDTTVEDTAAENTGAEDTTAAAPGTSGGEVDFVAEAKARVEGLYAGTFTVPPADSPPPATGKNVWVISYGEAYLSSALASSGGKAAGEALGWDVTVFDAEFDPSKATAGVRQAIADDADAIHMIYWDCEAVKAGVLEAKDAGILVSVDQASDCTEPLLDYSATFNAGYYNLDDGTFPSYNGGWSAVYADYIIAKTEGQAVTIDFRQTDVAAGIAQSDGFQRQYGICGTCKLVVVEFTGADLGPALQQKAEQALLENPEINAIVVTADAILLSGVQAAIEASGRADEIIVGGSEGTPEGLALMRQYADGIRVVNGFVSEWPTWAAFDAFNRIFNGEKPAATSGIGYQLVDLGHNLPAEGEMFAPTVDGAPIDYAALYTAAWTS
jgi:ribose transport system substrate-binding protein